MYSKTDMHTHIYLHFTVTAISGNCHYDTLHFVVVVVVVDVQGRVRER